MLEAPVKKKINKMLKYLWPDIWIFMPVQTGMGEGGIPDHIGIAPVVVTQKMVGETYGMGIFVEAKKPYHRPTLLQYTQLARLVKVGCFANYCSGPEDLPMLKRTLEKRFCLK